MVEELGSSLELLQYGHLRYKFPEQQVFPHGSFMEERDYLIDLFGGVTECELGPRDCSWSMLSVSKEPSEANEPSVYRTPPTSPPGGDDILEIAMEGLALDVCALFCRASAPSAESVYGASGATPVERELATRMTVASGLRELLPGVEIDDWAFEPCGYSMNGLRDGYYYTVHITPEPAFSYASFETNDPSYRDTEYVRRIVRAFAPSLAVVTLTTRRIGCELPAYELDGLERSALDLRRLGAHASVCCATFFAKEDKNAHQKPEQPFAKSQCQATLEPRGEMVQVS
uniref:S-adenosylmethionine decarboxylase proenzyme n=1 Tax=Chrysotila carterae TaxID=13221 RepID=A0A7S4F0J5_CHRCT